MKNYFVYLGLWLLCLCSLSSCEKVIDIDLNSSAPRIVIEGRITNLDTCTVIITKTVNFSNDNIFPTISGATVVVSDNVGNSITLPEIHPGIYQSVALSGVVGRTYFMTVTAEGKTYTSQSTMPAQVMLDSIGVIPSGGFGQSTKLIVPVFNDPIGIGNKYRFVEFQNRKRIDGYTLYNDNNTDGKTNSRPITRFNSTIKVNDTITLQMECIDQEVYKYFYSLNRNSSGQSSSPANPVSNISNDALGFFSANTFQSKSVVVH